MRAPPERRRFHPPRVTIDHGELFFSQPMHASNLNSLLKPVDLHGVLPREAFLVFSALSFILLVVGVPIQGAFLWSFVPLQARRARYQHTSVYAPDLSGMYIFGSSQ